MLPYGYWCSRRCWHIYVFNLNGAMVCEFWYSSESNFTSWNSKQPCFETTPETTLFRRSNLIFFTFESAETYRFLYIKDASFSRTKLLKLIHFKSRNSGVTWSSFKYFPFVATLTAKLIYFFYFILHAVFYCIYPYWTAIV